MVEPKAAWNEEDEPRPCCRRTGSPHRLEDGDSAAAGGSRTMAPEDYEKSGRWWASFCSKCGPLISGLTPELESYAGCCRAPVHPCIPGKSRSVLLNRTKPYKPCMRRWFRGSQRRFSRGDAKSITPRARDSTPNEKRPIFILARQINRVHQHRDKYCTAACTRATSIPSVGRIVFKSS